VLCSSGLLVFWCSHDGVGVVLCSSFDSLGLFSSLALPLHPADKQIQIHLPCGMPALHSTLMALNYLLHGPAYRTTRNRSPWTAYRRLPSLALLSLDQKRKIKPKEKKYEIHYQLPFIYQVLVCHLLKTSAWQKHLAAQKLSSSGWEWEWEWHHDPRRGY